MVVPGPERFQVWFTLSYGILIKSEFQFCPIHKLSQGSMATPMLDQAPPGPDVPGAASVIIGLPSAGNSYKAPCSKPSTTRSPLLEIAVSQTCPHVAGWVCRPVGGPVTTVGTTPMPDSDTEERRLPFASRISSLAETLPMLWEIIATFTVQEVPAA